VLVEHTPAFRNHTLRTPQLWSSATEFHEYAPFRFKRPIQNSSLHQRHPRIILNRTRVIPKRWARKDMRFVCRALARITILIIDYSGFPMEKRRAKRHFFVVD